MEGMPNVISPIGNTDERRLRGTPKIFQKRRVSSPAADTTVLPSGLALRPSTRFVWPVNSFTFVKVEPLPYFHKINWFSEKPCALTSSRCCLLHKTEHTCEPVSIELSIAPLFEFQNLIVRSAVPPPLASSPR